MKQKFKSTKSFDDVKGSDAKEPRIEELVDLYKFPGKQWVQVRFIGPLVSYGRHWIETKKADGSKTKFPKTCLAYDPETEEHDSTKTCPWCEASDDRVQFGAEYYTNAIIREIEEDGPGKKGINPSKTESKTGIKDRGSKTWTPVRVVKLTASMIREIKKLGGLNRHKDKKTGEKKAYSVSHPKYGCDISIQFDPNEKTASKKYTFQKGDPSPLSEEQQEYLVYQIEDMMKPDSKSEAQKDVKRWLEKMGKSKAKKSDDEDDSDEDSDDDSDEDDDEDEDTSKKNKGKDKKGSKNKKPSKSDDDDDDEDDDDLPEEDEDDDDEDDEPKGKNKKGKNKKSKSEDDEDDDLDDDEDEPKKSKGKSKKSKDSDDEDDDDLDDDDELDDEEDKPKGKKGKDKKGSKKSKKSSDEDDDEDDLDDDSEDEDDDEPKKSKNKKSKSKGKSKSKDDDDEDEDEDDDLDDDDD